MFSAGSQFICFFAKLKTFMFLIMNEMGNAKKLAWKCQKPNGFYLRDGGKLKIIELREKFLLEVM